MNDAAASADAFEREWFDRVRDSARRTLVLAGLVLGAGLVIALVVDLAVLRGTAALDHILTGLPAQALFCIVGAAALHWIPALRARPHAFGLFGFVVLATFAGYVLGGLGGMDGPYFYLAYLLPCVVIGVPCTLGMRFAFTGAILGAFLITFGSMRAGNFSHPFAHIAWLHLTVTATGFIYFGDLLHRTSRERFALEFASRREAARRELENRTLADEVGERVRDIVAATDRAAYVRSEERSQLARALHDDLGQLLVSARIHLADLERTSIGVEHEDRIQRLRVVIRDIEQSTRGVTTELRHAAVPFEVVVEDLVESFRALDRVEIALDLRCQEWEPTPEVREACLRTIQEGLSNVLKHARAKRAAVTVARVGNEVRVNVTDDGVGMPPPSEVAMGNGLRGMEERITSVGGRVTVEGREPSGMSVSVSIPVLGDRSVGSGATT